MHTLIGRIIIHIAHYKHLHILVDAKQTILDSLGLTSTRLTIERTRETAWPVTNDNSHILTCHFTTNRQETTSIISTILSLLLNIRHQLYILHREERRIVEESAINATTVWAFNMTVFHIAGLQRSLLYQIVQHLMVFHLCQSDESTPHLRQLIRTHVGKRLGHIAQLIGIFHSIPSLGRKIFVIILALIMTSIEEILLVIKTYSIEIESFLPLGKSSQADYQEGRKHQYIFLHKFIILFRLSKILS